MPHATPTDPPDYLARLAAYRLERGLTFDALAAEMAAAGYAVRGRALHFALTNRLKTRPRDTTLYRIDQFVRGLGAATAPRKSARRRRVA